MSVSVYFLSVDALQLLDNGQTALGLPSALRPVLRRCLRATRLKKGPKLSRSRRIRNMVNGIYAPETVRRYRWAERRAADDQFRVERMLEKQRATFGETRQPKVGTVEFAIMAAFVAKAWLV